MIRLVVDGDPVVMTRLVVVIGFNVQTPRAVLQSMLSPQQALLDHTIFLPTSVEIPLQLWPLEVAQVVAVLYWTVTVVDVEVEVGGLSYDVVVARLDVVVVIILDVQMFRAVLQLRLSAQQLVLDQRIFV